VEKSSYISTHIHICAVMQRDVCIDLCLKCLSIILIKHVEFQYERNVVFVTSNIIFFNTQNVISCRNETGEIKFTKLSAFQTLLSNMYATIIMLFGLLDNSLHITYLSKFTELECMYMCTTYVEGCNYHINYVILCT
jgi:hypothetical protein